MANGYWKNTPVQFPTIIPADKLPMFSHLILLYWIRTWLLSTRSVNDGSVEVIVKNNLVRNKWVVGLLKKSYVSWLQPTLRHGRRNWIHCYWKRSVMRWRNTILLQCLPHPVFTCRPGGGYAQECGKWAPLAVTLNDEIYVHQILFIEFAVLSAAPEAQTYFKNVIVKFR